MVCTKHGGWQTDGVPGDTSIWQNMVLDRGILALHAILTVLCCFWWPSRLTQSPLDLTLLHAYTPRQKDGLRSITCWLGAVYHYLREIFLSAVFFFTCAVPQCKAGSGSWGKEGLVFPFHRMRCWKISPRLEIMSVVDLRMEDLGVPSWHLGHGLLCWRTCAASALHWEELGWNHLHAQVCIFLCSSEVLHFTATLWSPARSDYRRIAPDKDKWCRNDSSFTEWHRIQMVSTK